MDRFNFLVACSLLALVVLTLTPALAPAALGAHAAPAAPEYAAQRIVLEHHELGTYRVFVIDELGMRVPIAAYAARGWELLTIADETEADARVHVGIFVRAQPVIASSVP